MPRSAAAGLGISVAIRSWWRATASERSSTGGAPTASRTASTPSGACWDTHVCTSSRKSNGSMPSSLSTSWSPGSAVPSTRAPRCLASCAAYSPTPPAAPLSRTTSPSATPVAATRWAAAVPVSISPAASSHDIPAGLGTQLLALATTRSAYAPLTGCTITSLPAGSAPASTTPAHSPPSRTGSLSGSSPTVPL